MIKYKSKYMCKKKMPASQNLYLGNTALVVAGKVPRVGAGLDRRLGAGGAGTVDPVAL